MVQFHRVGGGIMDRLIVAVFETEVSSYGGLRALRQLDEEGTISIYAIAVITKSETGFISLKQAADQGAIGTAVGLLTGSLVGMLAGVTHDLGRVGIEEGFLAEVGRALPPGGVAVVTEASEEFINPVDERLGAFDGIVFRRMRGEIIEQQLRRDAVALKAELDILRSEAQTRAELAEKIEQVKGKLRETLGRVKQEIEDAKQESEVKVKALEAKRVDAHAERKARIQLRIADVQANYRRRSDLLLQAWQTTMNALS
jgi:uncharacterized membrane protein